MLYGDQRMAGELQRANSNIGMLRPGMSLRLPPKVDNPYVKESEVSNRYDLGDQGPAQHINPNSPVGRYLASQGLSGLRANESYASALATAGQPEERNVYTPFSMAALERGLTTAGSTTSSYMPVSMAALERANELQRRDQQLEYFNANREAGATGPSVPIDPVTGKPYRGLSSVIDTEEYQRSLREGAMMVVDGKLVPKFPTVQEEPAGTGNALLDWMYKNTNIGQVYEPEEVNRDNWLYKVTNSLTDAVNTVRTEVTASLGMALAMAVHPAEFFENVTPQTYEQARQAAIETILNKQGNVMNVPVSDISEKQKQDSEAARHVTAAFVYGDPDIEHGMVESVSLDVLQYVPLRDANGKPLDWSTEEGLAELHRQMKALGYTFDPLAYNGDGGFILDGTIAPVYTGPINYSYYSQPKSSGSRRSSGPGSRYPSYSSSYGGYSAGPDAWAWRIRIT